MAAPVRRTYKAASVVLGGQTFVNLDYWKIPFQATVLADLVSGSVNYSIEFTCDDVSGTVDPTTLRWITIPNLPAGQTSTVQYTVNFPVTAVRINIQSMTGELRLTVIQGIGV